MRLGDLAKKVGGELVGDSSLEIQAIRPLDSAGPHDITFISDSKFLKKAAMSKAEAFITFKELPLTNQIIVKNPRKAVAQSILYLQPPKPIILNGISKNADIHPDTKLGEDVGVGAFTSVGRNTQIKETTKILSNVSIGENVTIGSGCIIHPNVTIYDNVTIGDRVIIHACSVIGADGFGYYPDEGVLKKIPQVGGVEIGDDVEIGANTTVDAGNLDPTRIGKGTKIDNQVQIAHNCQVGNHCIIASLCGLSGSVVVEDYVTLGGDVGISNGVTIGGKAVVAGRSGVTKDVPAGSTVSGFPAQEHSKELRLQAKLRRIK